MVEVKLTTSAIPATVYGGQWDHLPLPGGGTIWNNSRHPSLTPHIPSDEYPRFASLGTRNPLPAVCRVAEKNRRRSSV
jgi:hypothetical protein